MGARIKKLLKKSLLELDRSEKGSFFVMGIFYGVATIYGEYYQQSSLFHYLIDPSDKFSNILIAIASIIGTICGIAIPISIATVSNNLKEFEDPEIAIIFQNEKIFIRQIRGTFLLIIASVFILFFHCISPIIVAFLFIAFLLVIINFYRFIYLVLHYTTNTEEVVYNHTKKNIDDFLDDAE